jgi:putative endonuclease
MPRTHYVYIMASASGTLYIGMTCDLAGRVSQHKAGLIPGFTKQYEVNRLVYWETYPDKAQAFARERALKGWRRARKVDLIEAVNPKWKDVAEEAYGVDPRTTQRCV